MLTADLNETDAIADAAADQNRARLHRWTKEEAREAARLSRQSRATRSKSEPPSDAEIERGLRERAVSDPRAAEILLRWLQRPRAEERVGGVDLDSMSAGGVLLVGRVGTVVGRQREFDGLVECHRTSFELGCDERGVVVVEDFGDPHELFLIETIGGGK